MWSDVVDLGRGYVILRHPQTTPSREGQDDTRNMLGTHYPVGTELVMYLHFGKAQTLRVRVAEYVYDSRREPVLRLALIE